MAASDFNAFHQWRASRTKVPRGAPPVTFCAFDLLPFDGQDITGWPAEAPQDAAAAAPPSGCRTDATGAPAKAAALRLNVLLVDDLPADVETFQLVATLPIEGVVARGGTAGITRGVSSGEWRKVKRPGWQEGRSWTS